MLNKSVYVVAGGTSLNDFDFNKLRDKNVIAVNKSILDVPFAQRFITMDYTFIDHIGAKTDNKLTRDKFFQIPCEKYFIVATDNHYIRFRNGHYVDIRSNYQYNLEGFNHIITSNKPAGIGGNFYEFVHGCNSGFAALQLAIILGYTEINLLGIDLYINDKTHYHEGYRENKEKFEQRLKIYYDYYLLGIHNIRIKFPNVKLYSYSENSRLNSLISYKSLEEIQ